MSPSQFLLKAPPNNFSYAALQDWNEVSCRLMAKFVFWIADIWMCTAEREIYE